MSKNLDIFDDVKKLLVRLPVTIALPAIRSFVFDPSLRRVVVRTSSGILIVRINSLGGNFREFLLSKEEPNGVAAEELAVHKLLECECDQAIITALGGEKKVEVTLGQFFATFARQQPNAALLTNGYANIGYVRDVNGVLRAVFGSRWLDDGWIFGTRPISTIKWDEGDQFLSR